MKRLTATLFIILLYITAGATAATEAADTLVLDEVMVSAVKSVAPSGAGAVTSLDQATIASQAVTTPRDATVLTPGVFIPDYGSRMTSTIYSRGIGARIDQPVLGLVIDNVPILCKENYDMELPDMKRVDVLRGPQSMLYGRNTMGGVINISTLSPRTDPGTRVMLQGASHSSFKVSVSHNRAINAAWAIGATAFYTTTAGEFRNEYNGKLTDWECHGGGRLKVQWQGENGWSLTNVLSMSVSRQGGYPYAWTATGKIAHNDTCFYRRTNLIDGLTVRKQAAWGTVMSITSYQMIDDNMTLDQDFTPEPYFTLTQARTEHAVTQEFIVRSNPAASGWQWIAGAFGFYRRLKMSAPVNFGDTGIARLIEQHRNAAAPSYPIAWQERAMLLGSDFVMPTGGVAGYGQATYTTGGWTFAAGLRLDYEHSRLDYHSETHTGYDIMHDGEVYSHEAIDIDDTGRLRRHHLQLLPSFNVSHRWQSGNMVWLAVSRGFKAGGFNTQMFSDVLQQRLMGMMGIGARYDVDRIVGYKPEHAWNYEVGTTIKPLSNDDLIIAANAYWIDCTNRQLTVFPDGTTTGRVMTNAGRTRSVGIEATVQWHATATTDVNVAYGYCDARFVRYNDGTRDYRYRIVPYSPRHTLHADATQRINLQCSWAKCVELNVGVYGVGAIEWNEANTVSQPFYALMDTRVTLAASKWSVQLWAKNLTGTRYNTFYFVSIGHEFLQRGRGRALGATLRINL